MADNLPILDNPLGLVEGILGEALDVSEKYIALGNLTDWEETGQLSISMWAKWSGGGGGYQGLCGKRSGWSNESNTT